MTIDHVFFDIGGVLGTNGWDRRQRTEAAKHFGIEVESFSERHEEVVEAFESGQMSLDDYLDRTVFVRPRSFTPEDFRKFMYGCSKPFPDSIAITHALADSHKVRMSTTSNEADELSRYRIRLFGLTTIFDTFIASAWIGVRKPAPVFYQRALAITAARAENSIFIDDREENLVPARALGFHTIHFESADQLKRELAAAGLDVDNQPG